MLDQQMVLLQATLRSFVRPAHLESMIKPLDKSDKSKYTNELSFVKARPEKEMILQ